MAFAHILTWMGQFSWRFFRQEKPGRKRGMGRCLPQAFRELGVRGLEPRVGFWIAPSFPVAHELDPDLLLLLLLLLLL